MYKKALLKIINGMNEDQAKHLAESWLEEIKEIGIPHPDTCLMNRPHSHSADCDCGWDELSAKIVEILEAS